MIKSKQLEATFITLIAFGVHFFFDDLYFKKIRSTFNGVINQFGISHMLAYFIVGIPIFVGALMIANRKSFFENLGLANRFLPALLFAIICTLPMFIGFAILFNFNTDVKLNTILVSVFAAAFFEELYFRSFLFGQLFRHTSMGFLSSVFLGALIFGLIHLYQSDDPMELILIFLITFLGAILFGWVYVEWGYNLWVPIFLHLLMNLAWELFNISDTAVGDSYANLFRGATIVLVIILTIIYKRRHGIPLVINKRTFFIKKKKQAGEKDLQVEQL